MNWPLLAIAAAGAVALGLVLAVAVPHRADERRRPKP